MPIKGEMVKKLILIFIFSFFGLQACTQYTAMSQKSSDNRFVILTHTEFFGTYPRIMACNEAKSDKIQCKKMAQPEGN